MTETIRENRIRAVAALRAADESKRLMMNPLELDGHGNIVAMCACAVISQGLGLPMFFTRGGLSWAYYYDAM